MINQDDPPGPVEPKFHLPRIPCTRDLLSLALEYGETSTGSRHRQPLQRRSTNSDSENSDILYIAMPEKSNRRDPSLSSISSNSGQRLDGTSEGNWPGKENSASPNPAEKFSWDIIDQEIYEWQSVCRTGRPYWWSPKAKYDRLNAASARLANEPCSHLWAKEADDGPKFEYNVRRRAVSDSFLADPNAVGDMAHMIAVQLLSSCFTLPPDIVQVPQQSRTLSGKNMLQGYDFSDSQMISSLKMHTRYRYSPCFGHQGRNSSPVLIDPDTYDDLPSSLPPPLDATGIKTPDISTSNTLLRRRRVHRALHVTEGSATNCSLDSHTDDYLKLSSANVNLDPTVRTKFKLSQQVTEDHGHKGCIPSQNIGKEKEVQQALAIDSQPHGRISYPEVQRTHPKTRHELNLITRSESQHDFMQPVKDLVVKRWKTLRRRLGGSLHSNVPLAGFEQYPLPSTSRTSSPAMESDGKERRRRARASGDISSYESTPHYNSPVSSHFSAPGSGASSPTQKEHRKVHPKYPLDEPLVAAVSLALASGHSPTSSNVPARLDAQNPSNSDLVDDANQSRADTGHATHHRLNSTASNHSSSVRRSRMRQRRKSMLSEVFTAEDLVDEGTTNRSDNETEPNIFKAKSSTLPSLVNVTGSASDMLSPDSDISGSNKASRKPGLSRTSTSGTQVFSPDDEGVEIDGLPVGLSRHAWDGPGRRERSYL